MRLNVDGDIAEVLDMELVVNDTDEEEEAEAVGGRKAPYGDIYVAWYKSLITTGSQIFSARERNILFQSSKRQISDNMYNILQYFHDDKNNRNNNLLLVSIFWAVFLLTISGIKLNKSRQLSIISPSNTYLKFLIYSLVTQESFVDFFHRITAVDASW